MPASKQPQRPSEHQPPPQSAPPPQKPASSDVQRIQASLENLSSELVAALTGVVYAIEQLTLQAKQIKIMLDPVKLGTLLDLVTQLIQTHASDQTTVQNLQNQIDTLTTQDAALNDPALEAKMESLIDAASAAVPAGSAPPAGSGGAPQVNPLSGQATTAPPTPIS